MADPTTYGVLGSAQRPIYQPDIQSQNTAVGSSALGEPKIKEPSPSKEGNLGQKNPDEKPKEPVREKRPLVINILPLDEPMADKLSNAIDEMVYGDSIVPNTEYKSTQSREVEAYNPKELPEKSIDVES